MKISRVSRKYAAAYFELIRKQENPREALVELQSVSTLIEGEAELHRLLTHPQLSPPEKVQLVQKLLEKHVSEHALRLLTMLARNNRLAALPGICVLLEQHVLQMIGVQRAVITTAVPLDDGEKEHIRERLRSMTGKEIEMESRVDKGLIAGLTIQVGDKFIDGSVRLQLERVRAELKSARVG